MLAGTRVRAHASRIIEHPCPFAGSIRQFAGLKNIYRARPGSAVPELPRAISSYGPGLLLHNLIQKLRGFRQQLGTASDIRGWPVDNAVRLVHQFLEPEHFLGQDMHGATLRQFM